jgi:hypothetical protein
MNSKLLIDSVIRQTTVLIAHLATSAGLRAPLSHIANSVFLELSDELSAQGVSRKVAADMFGMALRTYQAKIQRLSARQDDERESVWKAVFEFVQERQVVSRADVLREFYDEDEEIVRGILWDLVESGLVFQKGRGSATVYRVASEDDLEVVAGRDAQEAAVPMIWLNVYLHGPVTKEDLAQLVSVDADMVDHVLEMLQMDGRIQQDDAGAQTTFSSEVCVVPMDEPAGWEASFFDHFNAVVTAACIKLRNARLRTLPDEVVGGSTYSFQIWDGHPYAERVAGLLGQMRSSLSELRAEVDDHNTSHESPDDEPTRVTFYFGQSVIEPSHFDPINTSSH